MQPHMPLAPKIVRVRRPKYWSMPTTEMMDVTRNQVAHVAARSKAIRSEYPSCCPNIDPKN